MDKIIKFFWWLRPFMRLWVRVKIFPKKGLISALGLNPKKPTCYVLNTRSFKDLFVLDHCCENNNLPRPRGQSAKLTLSSHATFLCLNKPGIIQAERSKKIPSELLELMRVVSDKQLEVQIVPVSIFWGRNPGKQDKSILKLLFFDDDNGGFFQRFITFFVHGRNVFCNFGKPISLLSLVNEKDNLDEISKKLRRVLRIHFRRQKETIVGPHIYDRPHVVKQILSTKKVKDIIASESEKSNLDVSKIEKRARKYAEEVCAKVSPETIHFFDILLSWLWKKIYSGLEIRQSEKIRELAEEYELVYMPSHRSHMDYLLIGYVLYYLGLLPPHTIAGLNLNFWPVGPLLRRGGAIFIRRSFRGNRLYGAIVSEFINFLLSKGFPLCFYPEGGRSRSGFLLQPKIGILGMVLEACKRETRKPVLLIPVFVAYDRVMEYSSYQNELVGKIKKKESLAGLVKASQLIRSFFGKAHIGFGEPLEIESYLDKKHPSWRTSSSVDSAILKTVAIEMMRRTNSAAIVSPVSLIALILQASPNNALSESDLLEITRIFVKLGKTLPLGDYVHFPNTDSLLDDIKNMEALSHVIRFSQQDNDVIYLSKRNNKILNYYRNNICHLFYLPSMICHVVSNSLKLQRQLAVEAVGTIYKFIHSTFFLHWPIEGIAEQIDYIISKLVDIQILHYDDADATLNLPKFLSDEFLAFNLLASISSELLQKYGLYMTSLLRYSGLEYPMNLVDFDNEISQMAMRISILHGMTTNTFFDGESYGNFMSKSRQFDLFSLNNQSSIKIPSGNQMNKLRELAPLLIGPRLYKSIAEVPIIAGHVN